MTNITLDGNDYDHIIDADFTEKQLVALPDWVNEEMPDVDTNVWTRQVAIITYMLRVNDEEKYTLDIILLEHSYIKLTDNTYGLTNEDVWMRSLEAEYDGKTNWANPWLLTIELVTPRIQTISCPEGEQIVNGGFETGDLTGWTSHDAFTVEFVVHAGSYACELFKSDGDECHIEQDIETLQGEAIPVICISSFNVWLHGLGTCPPADGYILITYSDSTTTQINFNDLGNDWLEVNILAELNITKSISKIKIVMTNYSVMHIDDVSLVC